MGERDVSHSLSEPWTSTNKFSSPGPHDGTMMCELCYVCGKQFGLHGVVGNGVNCPIGNRVSNDPFRSFQPKMYLYRTGSRGHEVPNPNGHSPWNDPDSDPATQRSAGMTVTVTVIPGSCDTCGNPNDYGATANIGERWRCGQCRALRQVFG